MTEFGTSRSMRFVDNPCLVMRDYEIKISLYEQEPTKGKGGDVRHNHTFPGRLVTSSPLITTIIERYILQSILQKPYALDH
jgi:hypothetical protein